MSEQAFSSDSVENEVPVVEVEEEEEEELPLFRDLTTEEMSTHTRLHSKYCFWFMKLNSGKKTERYDKALRQVGSFETVEGFWRIYNHLLRPNDLPKLTDHHLFKDGIKPMWEDPANKMGGQWLIRLKKGIASKYWEELVLAIIGEMFDEGNDICGAVVSIRYHEDIISLWNKTANDKSMTDKLRDTMNRILELPSFISLEYKRHDASMVDKSSFRNTTVWRHQNPNHHHDEGSSSSSRGGPRKQRPTTNHSKYREGHHNHNGRNTPSRGGGGHREWRNQTKSKDTWRHDSTNNGSAKDNVQSTPKSNSGRRREIVEDDDGWQRQR